MKRWASVILSVVLGCAAPKVAVTPMPAMPDALGFAGGYAGASHGVFLFAGGSNFPEGAPWEGGPKHYYDRIFALQNARWSAVDTLPRPIAYGASVSDADGVICIGGTTLGDTGYSMEAVVRLEWVDGQVRPTWLPPLPTARTYACAAIVGHALYVAGGQIPPPQPQFGTAYPSDEADEHQAYRLDLSKANAEWEILEPLPGRSRILATAASCDGAFWVIGGAHVIKDATGKPSRQYLSDAHRYDPGKGWTRVADLPVPMAASPSPAPVMGDSIFILGGDDGSAVNTPPTQHPGFNRHVLRYDVKHDRWADGGTMPVSQVTTPAVPMDGGWIICGGEVRPGVRTPAVWRVTIAK